MDQNALKISCMKIEIQIVYLIIEIEFRSKFSLYFFFQTVNIYSKDIEISDSII